jgi:hypothetical protein
VRSLVPLSPGLSPYAGLAKRLCCRGRPALRVLRTASVAPVRVWLRASSPSGTKVGDGFTFPKHTLMTVASRHQHGGGRAMLSVLATAIVNGHQSPFVLNSLDVHGSPIVTSCAHVVAATSSRSTPTSTSWVSGFELDPFETSYKSPETLSMTYRFAKSKLRRLFDSYLSVGYNGSLAWRSHSSNWATSRLSWC